MSTKKIGAGQSARLYHEKRIAQLRPLEMQREYIELLDHRLIEARAIVMQLAPYAIKARDESNNGAEAREAGGAITRAFKFLGPSPVLTPAPQKAKKPIPSPRKAKA